MKNKVLKVSVLVGFVSLGMVQTAIATDQSVNIGASIVTAITASSPANLNFGSLVPGAGTGTISVNATTGTPTYDGVNLSSSSQFGTVTRGTVTVNGTSGSNVALTLSGSTTTLSGSGSATGQSLSVDNIALESSTCILSGGTCTVGIGGRLTVPNGATAGPYSGSITVTALYS